MKKKKKSKEPAITVLDVLRQSYKLILDPIHYCDDAVVRDRSGDTCRVGDSRSDKWGADGALVHTLYRLKVGADDPLRKESLELMAEAVKQRNPSIKRDLPIFFLIAVNKKGHDEALNCYRRGIKLAKAKLEIT